MEKSPADVLDEAADLLLIHGRCEGSGEKGGKFCVLGAVARVRGLTEEYEPEIAWSRLPDDLPELVALERALSGEQAAFRSGPYFRSIRIYDWNDNHAEDDFEVIDTLRLVAKELRREEQGG